MTTNRKNINTTKENIPANDNEIDVSFVMTVYNKAYYLPAVIHALLNQTGLKNPEYIFVDDLSKDNSVALIRELTKGKRNVKIVAKEVNEGISVTTNQALKLATGKFIRPLDSDDILPLNSTAIMLKLAQSTKADMVYGKFIKTGQEPDELKAKMMSEEFSYKYNPNALNAVLGGHFTRMGQLFTREVIEQCKGTDERVFIQDESLPLRAALVAKGGAIKMDAHVVLVPKETNSLSKNFNQLDNDRFFANYYVLKDNYKNLDKKTCAKLYEKTLSANWKYVKKNKKSPYLTLDFIRYLKAKAFHPQPDFAILETLKERFLSLDNVLRTKGKNL